MNCFGRRAGGSHWGAPGRRGVADFRNRTGKKNSRDCRWWLSLLCWICMISLQARAAATATEHPTGEEPARPLKVARPLKIAYCRYMPFYFEGINQKPRGILVDVWEQWSRQTGIPVEFVLMPWEKALEEVAAGRVDINALMYPNPERDRLFDFSQSILHLTTYVYFRPPGENEAEIRSLGDLNHVTTGVVTRDFTHDYLNRKLPNLVPLEFPDHESLIRAALDGKIRAFLMEGPVASTYIAKNNGIGRIMRLPDPLFTKPLHAGVRQGNTRLLDLVNQGLSQFGPGDIDRIVRTWTGEQEPVIFRPYAGKVRIVASIDNMPFHFADEKGRAVGMFVDLWRLWAQKTGIDVEFTAVPWADSLAMVRSGRADIHAGCFFSVHRDTFLDYAGVLRNCETHFFFHESIFGLKNLEDLKGFQIGVVHQDYAVEFVNRELPDAALKIYKSHQHLFRGIASGEVRVFVCDTPTALYFLEKEKLLSSFRYHPAQPLYRKPFYAAVKEGNTPLVLQINRGLAAITREERAAIERKWMGISDADTLEQADHIVVAAPRDYPPFSMRNAQGRPSGLFVDLWERWSRQTGLPVVFRLYDREAAVHALKDGIVDVLSFLPPSGAVRGWTEFTTPFYRLDWYRYHHRKIGRKNWSQRMSATLGVVSGTRAHEWLVRNRPDLELQTYADTRQMILSAANGTVNRFVALPQEMAVLPGQLGLPGTFVREQSPLIRQLVGAGVRNYNPDLITAIEDGFNTIDQADLVRIETRWLGDVNARIFHPKNRQIRLSADEKAWLVRHHDLAVPIRLGVTSDWPPFEFTDQNRAYLGMVSDYVALLNQRLGLNMTVSEQVAVSGTVPRTPGPWENIDVMPCALSFEADYPHLKRTIPYLRFPWVVINKRQAPLIGGLRDLYGKTVAVVDRYTVRRQIAMDHPDIGIMAVEKAADGLAAVSSGKADAYIGNLAVVGYLIQAGNDTGLKVAASTDLTGNGLSFSVRKDWPELVSILNKGIEAISDQEHDAIRQKWFSVRFEHGVDTAYVRGLLLKTGLAALLVTGLFLFWNRQIRLRKEAAEAANRSKTRFLASLGHEIRTPLNAILGLTDMTLRDGLRPHQAKNLTAVKESARHLLEVISELLDFSTLEAGKMRIQSHDFSLDDLLESLAHTWSFQAGEKGLDFHLGKKGLPPGIVRSDSVRLRQILGNLVSNAVKFTAKGEVKLLAAPASPSDLTGFPEIGENQAYVSFTVSDTGIGIEPDQLEKIFQRFTQAEESITRRFGGTGLGLAICRETARLMGGALTVTSTPGQGSCFTLVLPLETVSQRPHADGTAAQHPAVGSGPPPASAQPGLTLLLAEDDAMNTRVFYEFLSRTRHRILHAGDGEAALELLGSNEVDMVFMDIEMPRLDGLTACERIRQGRAGQRYRDIPVIAMSAHVLAEYREKCTEAGMNDFIPKPVDVDLLIRTIERFRPETVREAPQWDREKALASLGGNPDLLDTVCRIFVRETPAQVGALEAALARRDLETVIREAHTLKGSAGRLFAGPAGSAARAVENLARRQAWEQLPDRVDALKSTLSQLTDELENRHGAHT